MLFREVTSSESPTGRGLLEWVPLHIGWIAEAGGPKAEELRAARGLEIALAREGARVEAADYSGDGSMLFAELAKSLAVLAFRPAGVRFVGHHWEAPQPVR